jgi:hypothetical protein
MSEDGTRKHEGTSTHSNVWLKWLIGAAVIVLAFLIGFVPMWLSNRQLTADLASRQKDLRRSRIQSTLTAATIFARRGEYETARQNTSSFFTELRGEIDKGDAGVLNEQERIGVNRVLADRDEIITLLSRNDPASGERLSNLYVEYVAVVAAK